MNNIYLDDEVSRYRKKKGKNKPRTKKSNHKHEYETVLVKTFINGHDHYSLGKKCIHCGKTEETQFFISEKVNNWGWKMLNNSEILEKYNDLEIVEQKF